MNMQGKNIGKRALMRIGIATDFGWFDLKTKLITALSAAGYEITDIDAYELVVGENYPDFVIPLAKTIPDKNNKRKQTLSEACASVNKLAGVCAAVITETDALKVDDDDLYVRCLGAQIKGYALSNKKAMTFLNADCVTAIPSNQRLAKIRILKRENKITGRRNYTARPSEYNSVMEES